MLAVALAMSLAAVEPASAVETVLRARLMERYPTVTRWDIHPFTAQPPDTSGDAKVVVLGARSAVQVGRRVYWYSVAGFGTALIATHAVAPGQPLNTGDGRLTEGNLVAANCDPLRAPADLSDKRARKTLRANEIICSTQVEPRPWVARGEAIVVRYVGPNVSLTTNGVAQKDGVAGDSLLVLNPNSHDLFRAVVSGVREVTIHE